MSGNQILTYLEFLNSKIGQTVQKLGYFKQINCFQWGRGGFKISFSTWLNICSQDLRKQKYEIYFFVSFFENYFHMVP